MRREVANISCVIVVAFCQDFIRIGKTKGIHAMKHYRSVLAVTVASAMFAGVSLADDAAASAGPSASISLGVTVNDGNTDNNMVNLGLGYENKPCDKSLIRLAASSAYGETDGEKDTDNNKASLDYHFDLCSAAYAAFNTSYADDDIAGLDYRVIVAPGVGVYLMKNDDVTMTLEVAPALLSEKKDGSKSDDFAIRFAERYDRSTGSSAKWWQSAEYIPHADDFDIYVLVAEIGVEAPVSEKLNVRLVVKDTYDSDPAPGRDNNDVTVIGALAYSLF